MTKVIMSALLLISSSAFADLFTHNTDETAKYEFDSSVTEKNEEMVAKIAFFKMQKASQTDIQEYLSLKDGNETLNFSEDVLVDYSGSGVTKDVSSVPMKTPWYSFSFFETNDVQNDTQVIEKEVK